MMAFLKALAVAVVGLLAPALHHKIELDAPAPLYRVAY